MKKEYFENLDGHDKVLFSENGLYHAILLDNKKVGVVSYIPVKSPKNSSFIQIELMKKLALK